MKRSLPLGGRVLVAVFAVVIIAAATVPTTALPADADVPSEPLSAFMRNRWRGLGPETATGARPLLVIYEYYSDHFPETGGFPGRKDEAWLSERIFGPGYPSVNGYFEANSRGRFSFRRAVESGGATVNDGVIAINVGTRADWEARKGNQGSRFALEQVEPFIEFDDYDVDENGRVTWNELAILKMEVEPQDNGTSLGIGLAATEPPADGPALDGVTVNGDHQDDRGSLIDGGFVARVNSTTNLMTIAHELMHATFGMVRDYYAYFLDNFDVMSSTISAYDDLWMVNSWNAMQMGWTQPTVVTRDGYVDIARWDQTSGAQRRAFLLYDPAKGTDDFLLVENRLSGAARSYDREVSHPGLTVWRIDQSTYWQAGSERTDEGEAPHYFPIKRIVPCEGKQCPDRWHLSAWDPTDPATPQRVVSTPWRDGTASRVSIRAIGAPGDVTRAYMDVPGPGALVDCFDARTADRRLSFAGRAGEPLPITVPVMNTGDAPDTLTVRTGGLLPGWAATTVTRSYGAHAEAQTGRIALYPPVDARPGKYQIPLIAERADDPSYSSRCTVSVHVRAARDAWGYVWADQPTTPAYTPDPGYQANSSGTTATVQRWGPGTYTVRMPEMGVVGGVAHVTPYGRSPNSCQATHWNPGTFGPDQFVNIRCSTPAGAAADTQFTMWFTRRWRTPSGSFAHVFADKPAHSTYRVESPNLFTTGFDAAKVDRAGVGRYQVTLRGIMTGTGIVQVSPVGTKGARNCQTESWSWDGSRYQLEVFLRCFTSSGSPADSQFTMTYVTRTTLGGTSDAPRGHVWARSVAKKGSRITAASSYNSSGGTNSVTRRGTGWYTVELPGLGVQGGTATVTPYGSSFARCNVGGWGAREGTEHVTVRCYDAQGAPRDASFTVTFAADPPPTTP